jgi:predicted DNA-binding transcriptional regulator YafY
MTTNATSQDTVDLTTPTRVVFSVSEAAKACRVDRKTITRKMDQLETAGAYKDDSGYWQIPVASLEEVGLRPGRPTPAPADTPKEPAPTGRSIEEWHQLEMQALRLQGERDVAIARAEGAERALAEASARANFVEHHMIAIEASPTATPPPRPSWRERRRAARKAENTPA